MHMQGRRDLRLGSRTGVIGRQKQNRMHIPFPECHTRMYAFPSCLLSVSANHARAMALSGTCVTISRKAVCTHGGDLSTRWPGYSMRAPNLTVLSVRNGGLTWAMSQTAHELRPYVRFVQSCRNDPMPKDFQGIFGNRCYPWQFLPSS